ncbi:hypothetical protein [Streptomyces sp. WMMC897]|nr:hypothetical protein [Streptomyces sp. WMMC897]MCZ7413054.1 hypothetical protein [Streptomyces sp. WMMC897]MCZ7413142.1 hypothetical protein [Streptomyces sp. WMMC897]MCZ7415474.1 hypothetical protein [Streptomyces sp. WMMC897]
MTAPKPERRPATERATVDACRRDYQQGAAARRGLDADAQRRHGPRPAR